MNKKIFLISAAFVVLLLVLLVYAATSYRVANNTDQKIDEFSTPKCVVLNSCPGDVFVPTKTSSEWSSFYNNPPSCATVCNMTATESDNGKDYYIGGNCTEEGIGACSGKCSTTYNDSCSGEVLTEYYVSGIHCLNETYDCPDLCVTNRCVDVCFDSSTLVTLADGTRKRITEVKVGDRVKAFNQKTKRVEFATVEKTLIHNNQTWSLDKIKFSNDIDMIVTPNHPILTVNGSWVHVADLSVGDEVYELVNNTLMKVKIISIIREYSKDKVVYNLKTTLHDYFADDILVHNKCVMEGTLINTPLGLKRVETLKPGDIVYGTKEGKIVPTKIIKFFEKEVIIDIPGKILPNGEVVTNNHIIEYKGKKVRAGKTDLKNYLIKGKVYDLQTGTGDYYVNGIRTWFDY